MDDDPNSPEDETGHYWITDVPAGDYVVREVVPAGFIQSSPRFALSATRISSIGLAVSPVDGIAYQLLLNGGVFQTFNSTQAINNVAAIVNGKHIFAFVDIWQA